MTAPLIPDPIPRARVGELCKQLGLDPSVVEALEFKTFGLYVTFHATDEDGRKLLDGQDVARHRIFVPYAEEDAP